MISLALLTPIAAAAQTTEVPRGTISGVVRLATPGVELEPTNVQLVIDRADSDQFERVEQPLGLDGSFAFDVEADATINYFAAVSYAGVPYLSNPLLISPDIPSATVEFEVFAASSVAPVLSIEETVVTVLAIDRERAELTLVREDRVRHDEPIIYIGDDDRVTLRLPAPDRTVDAGGLEDAAETYEFSGAVVTVTTPLRPGVTSIVTRYTVRYETNEDEYRLRITSPVQADHIEIRVPQRFLRDVEPRGDDAIRGEDDAFEGEPLTVIERATPAGPGQGLVADLIGLSGIERASHPLTSGLGAGIGALLALVVLSGVAIALQRRAQESA